MFNKGEKEEKTTALERTVRDHMHQENTRSERSDVEETSHRRPRYPDTAKPQAPGTTLSSWGCLDSHGAIVCLGPVFTVKPTPNTSDSIFLPRGATFAIPRVPGKLHTLSHSDVSKTQSNSQSHRLSASGRDLV